MADGRRGAREVLNRVISVILGGMFFAAGAYTLFLQFTDLEGTRSFILVMGGVLLITGAWGLRLGLRRRRR